MKKSSYYQHVIKRENIIKKALLGFFLGLCSYPRMLLEVFIRKNFGERYFKLSSAVTIFIILFLIPFGTKGISMLFNEYGRSYFRWDDFFRYYTIWYLFLFAFLFRSILHKKDLKRNPSVFDFKRFSLYAGNINEFFYKFKIPGRTMDIRTVEIFSEPLLFFLIGIGLDIIGQAALGNLLIVCSLFYSLSYAGAYYSGDEFVMDKIDEMICNQDLEKTFAGDEDEESERGVRIIGRRPADPEIRKKIAESMLDDEGVEAL